MRICSEYFVDGKTDRSKTYNSSPKLGYDSSSQLCTTPIIVLMKIKLCYWFMNKFVFVPTRIFHFEGKLIQGGLVAQDQTSASTLNNTPSNMVATA